MKITDRQLSSIIMESIKKKLDESLFGKKNKDVANQDVVKPEPAVRRPYNGKPLTMHWGYLHPEWDEPLIKKAAELEFELTNRERPTTPEEIKDIERKVMAEFPFNQSQGDFVSTSSGDLFEQKLRKTIKKMVRESLESFGGLSQFEETDGEKEDAPKKLEKSDSGKADFNDETDEEKERRYEVEGFFKKDGVDIAPYAYKLYGVEAQEGEDTNEMKNARGKFMKCLNHEPNQAGYPYSFTSAEINQLQSEISSNQLSENMEKQVVKINEETLRKIVGESVKKVLNEIGDTPKGQYAMGKLAQRKVRRGNNPPAPQIPGAYIKGKERGERYSNEDWAEAAGPAKDERKKAYDRGEMGKVKKMKKAFNKGAAAYDKENGHPKDISHNDGACPW